MEKILFVGMDVHKDTISNAVLNGHDDVPELEVNFQTEKNLLESLPTNLRSQGQ